MILEVYEQEDSLESIILGIQKDVARKLFHQCADLASDIGAQITFSIDKVGQTPRFIKDGVVLKQGSYPDVAELASWLAMDPTVFNDVCQGGNLFVAANDGRISACCGVGTDVYLDPYEEKSKE